jgi:uncharacterized membrane protein YraQ (UPF0718 family)
MLIEYSVELWDILVALAPWLFVGASIAMILKAVLPHGLVSRQLGQARARDVVKSVVVGIPLPLCSCGVLPTALGLKRDGASNAATTGFLISTPQTGVDSLLVTASFLGWPLALFKVLAAFVTGLVGGIAVHFWDRERHAEADVETESCDCCDEGIPSESKSTTLKDLLDYGVNDLIGSVYRYIALGILVAALIATVIPPDYIAQFPALDGILGMFLVLAIALPLYVCSTGSVPIAASLVQAGLPLGSAVVFLMAGPATNAATLSATLRSFGRRVTFIYLGTVVLGSLAFALIFQSLVSPDTVDSVLAMDGEESLLVLIPGNICAIALVLLMVRWALLDLRQAIRNRRGDIPLHPEEEGCSCNS